MRQSNRRGQVTARRSRRSRTGWLAIIATVVAALNYLLVGGAAGAGPTPVADVFVPISPTTLVSGHALAANQIDTVTIAGGAATNVPTGATAAQLDITLTGSSAGSGWLDAYPSGGIAVTAAHWLAGQTLATEVTVRLGASGQASFRARTHNVTFTAQVTGYYVPATIAPGSVTAADLAPAGSTTGQVLTATAHGVTWQSPSRTYTATPLDSDWKWNSQYVFETSPGSYTEYFTRYVTLAVPALTQAVLDNGFVQVFMTPSPLNNPGMWEPLPYTFDSSFGYTDNFVYVSSPGQVVLHFFFIQTSSSASLPVLSTYGINTYHFKIVVTPGAGSATPVTPTVTNQHATARTAHEVCTPFPGGRRCHAG